MGNYYTCGPNELLVISGGCGGRREKKYVSGGYAYVWWGISDAQYLTLEALTVYPRCLDVETREGVAVNVSTVASCKIINEPEFLKMAAEQFLGRDNEVIKFGICNSLEGSLRAVLGNLTIEEIYRDRENFSRKVRQIVDPELARMGLKILSFTIRDIWDNVDYLKSLGRAQIAAIKRDAAIGVAQAERDAGIREAETEKEAQNVVFDMKTKIENHSRTYEVAKAAFDKEVNTAKAQAALAYELQAAITQQQIRSEEVAIDIIERKKTAEVEAKEIERMEKELISTVKLPSEADSYKITQIAEGMKIQVTEEGKGEAEKMQLLGKSEANTIQIVGNADAQHMLLKAQVFKTYGTPAIVSLVLDSLPKITSEISMPLKNVNEIVIIGGSDGVTSDLNRLLGQIPPSLSAIGTSGLERIWNKNG